MDEALAREGIRFERKGSGAVMWIGDEAVKASSAGRDCSLSALQKRFGELTGHPFSRFGSRLAARGGSRFGHAATRSGVSQPELVAALGSG
jgi:hypothetical protein